MLQVDGLMEDTTFIKATRLPSGPAKPAGPTLHLSFIATDSTDNHTDPFFQELLLQRGYRILVDLAFSISGSPDGKNMLHLPKMLNHHLQMVKVFDLDGNAQIGNIIWHGMG